MENKFDAPKLQMLQQCESYRNNSKSDFDAIDSKALTIESTRLIKPANNSNLDYPSDYLRSWITRAVRKNAQLIISDAKQMEQDYYESLAVEAGSELQDLAAEARIIEKKRQKK
jgi:hypothetical protein